MANILIHIVQLIGIVVPFIGCVSLLRRVQSRTSIYLLLANLGCLIINGSICCSSRQRPMTVRLPR